MLIKKDAFTLIELIMVIVIIAIIALSSSAIIMFFMRNAIFLPNQMNVQQIADVAMDIMIEGDEIKGLRFARRITDLSDNRIQFINTKGQSISYEMLDGVIKRSVDAEAYEPIPYYTTGNITISGEENRLFRFFKQNADGTESETSTPADVRRVEIKLAAMSGTGDINDWEGRIALGSSVKIYKFNQAPVFTLDPTATPPSISKKGKSTITFRVNDPDGGLVNWTATATSGTLNPANGVTNVPSGDITTTYTAPNKTGFFTITVNLNDGSGGTATSSVPVLVY